MIRLGSRTPHAQKLEVRLNEDEVEREEAIERLETSSPVVFRVGSLSPLSSTRSKPRAAKRNA